MNRPCHGTRQVPGDGVTVVMASKATVRKEGTRAVLASSRETRPLTEPPRLYALGYFRCARDAGQLG